MKSNVFLLLIMALMYSCFSPEKEKNSKAKIRLITLDPGHFHAALVQKTMYPQIDTNVYVYGPAGDDMTDHLLRIDNYNSRTENPTHWNEIPYQGPGFFETMLTEKPGNVVVIAGNNKKKTPYILACVNAGLNVLADKPMAINMQQFILLEEALENARNKGVLLYDIMTERSEITTLLQREFSLDSLVFGTLLKGTSEEPAVTKESVHHFYKFVSGSALKRPAWFFDVKQQGEGIVDVTTHLVDLIQWECFPEQVLDYKSDINILDARRWSTPVTLSQFEAVTRLDSFPEFLQKEVKDTMLYVFANGEINYKIKDIHAKVSVTWNYRAPEGTGDTHYSIMRGTKANLVIRQGKEQNFRPALYIEPVNLTNETLYKQNLSESIKKLQTSYPGLEISKNPRGWEVVIPDKYRIGHEEHFAQVTERYLQYLKDGRLPIWEAPNMLAKYYTLVKALEMAQEK